MKTFSMNGYFYSKSTEAWSLRVVFKIYLTMKTTKYAGVRAGFWYPVITLPLIKKNIRWLNVTVNRLGYLI